MTYPLVLPTPLLPAPRLLLSTRDPVISEPSAFVTSRFLHFTKYFEVKEIIIQLRPITFITISNEGPGACSLLSAYLCYQVRT